MRRSDAAAQRKEEGQQPEAEEAAEEEATEKSPLKRGKERVSTSTMNEWKIEWDAYATNARERERAKRGPI